ncbi:MYXO-CTERM domain-containing protein [Aquabacterium commune]|uniref:MYXO-CTERM domain-containing protein n=1 Tax=Aquabacterium commune TaxID=70586 RepID=A0A4R6QZI6_9BURK|nr:prenyltransferase/squalene oxidase repeat-containing protein [Aquabacterium commune]TDP78733.1 MYXO-CTERM domain-containing protein [Aquabacterium commune]
MGNQGCVAWAVWRRAIGAVALLTGQVFVSAQAGVYAGPAQSAAAWLESQQAQSDGSWRDTSETRTFLQTAEAVLALHQANRRNAAYYAGQAWIENHDPQNLDARARRLMVLRATQSSAQQDIDALLAAVNTPAAGQSGWGLSKRYRSSPLDTALALDALRTAGATFSSAQAIAYLKSSQLTTSGDQGWAAAAGNSTDAYTTARVVQALAAYKSSDTTLTAPLNNAVATLKTKVTASSAPHVRAAAALAYLRLDAASNDAKTLLNSLVTIQRPDGGFDAGVFATGLITQAFVAAEGKDASTSRERVEVTDAALRTAINEALGRGAMDQLNKGELAELTTLDISNRGVTSLNGLQHAVNLASLNASNNVITDTSPIAGLINLTNTDLSGNPCTGPGCGTQVASGDGDTPLPLWALGMLGAALMGLVSRTGRRSDSGA